MTPKVEKITKLPLSKVWKGEATDFTPWLCENIDYLTDILGFEINNPVSEQTTENFRVDIQAELEDGSNIVIENQFGASNHDHLGKIITYRTTFEAKVAIWIVEEAKKEHIDAFNWLNETDNGCDFYLIKAQVIQIGESIPAPLFSIEAGPSSETRAVGKIKKELSIRHQKRLEFWSDLLSTFKQDKRLSPYKNLKPTKDSFISGATGISGISWTLWLNKENMRVEVRIDKGKGSDEENEQIYNKLKESKTEIDTAFGYELQWDLLPGYRVCAIRFDFPGGWNSHSEEWGKIIHDAGEYTAKLIEATRPYINNLK